MRRGFFAAVSGAIMAGVLNGCGPSETARAEELPPSVSGVSTEVVGLEPSATVYEATGVVRARLNTVLSSKVAARVESVAAREGDSVRAGQPLIVLDGRELRAAVDVASANVRAAAAGVGSATTTAEMERQTSAARVLQAQAALGQAKAAANAARSKLDLALAGPRPEERTQAHLAVQQAEASLRQAKTDLDRYTRLVEAGAVAGRLLDSARTNYDVAVAQHDSAVQAEKMAEQGTRAEEVRAAREAVAQAEAAVSQSRAALVQAQASQLQVAVRREDVRAALAQVGQTQATLRSVRATLGYGAISAPFDGVVVARSADPGAMAVAGAPLMTIEGGGLRLETVVPESMLSHVRIGQRLPVRVDALGGTRLSAQVAEIAPQGDAATHSFLAKLALPTVPGVRSGMFGRAEIRTGSKRRLTIPAGATWQREGLHYVYALNRDRIARLRIVTLGESSANRIEVLSGLSAGEAVVIDGLDKVRDGVEVRP